MNFTEEVFRLVFETATDALFIHDITGKFLEVNDRACELTGFTRAELLTMSVQSISQNFDPDTVEMVLKAVNEHGSIGLEDVHRRKDGSLVSVEVRVSVVEHEGRVLMLSAARDMTERLEVLDALRDSEEKFRNIVNNSPMGMHLYKLHEDGRLVLVDANPAADEILKTELAPLFGKTIEEAFPPLIETEVPDAYKRVAASGGNWSTEQIQYDDGKIAGAFAVNAFQNSPGNLAVFFLDITERHEQELERLELERQMQQAQKLESLGVLAGGVAHDFNNILMGVLGNAELALQEMRPESPARENVQAILDAAVRAAELARQMLAYSGKGRFVVQEVDLNSLVKEMVHLLKSAISKNAVLKFDLADELPPVKADATQLRQVVMNLITNASDAIGDNHGVISVSSGTVEIDESYLDSLNLGNPVDMGLYTYFEVSDNGCGMDAETRQKMFDPFFTTKFTGRGLGMAATLGILRGHDGAIKVYSEPGRGTSIKVFLPALPVQDGAGTAMPPGRPARRHDGGGRTVLIVDDEPGVLEIGRQVLELYGYKVLTARDGFEGLELYRAHKDTIDIVLLDMTMPKMDGKETFSALKAIDPDVKVVLSSGYNEQDATVLFGGKGLVGFLHKPYRPSRLIEVLSQQLGINK